jgi:hypothetical protein
MKHIAVILLSFFLVSVSVNAQEEKLSKREKRKLERKTERERTYERTGHMLDSMKFVLEADYLDNQRGNRMVVSNTLNFIKVDSDNAVLQIGRNTGIGNNGVGGTTAEGRISRYEVRKNEKKKTYDVRMNVNTNIGHYDIFMMVTSDGSARATLTGIYPGKLIWDGDIVAIDESRIYKGRTLY